jgi:peptidoglycan hydrolase FlgJ
MIGSATPLSDIATHQAKPLPELRAAAQKFEAVFLRQLIGSMRKAQLADDMFGSAATDSFRELADARTADAMAEVGQFGIAKMLEKQFVARKSGS